MLDNAPMIHIIEEWRSKWKLGIAATLLMKTLTLTTLKSFLAGRWQEVTLADIIIDLDNIHDHLRLGAVATCSMAALHKIPVADLTKLGKILLVYHLYFLSFSTVCLAVKTDDT